MTFPDFTDKAELANKFIFSNLKTEEATQAQLDKAIEYNDTEYIAFLTGWTQVVRDVRASEHWLSIETGIDMHNAEFYRPTLPGEDFHVQRNKRHGMLVELRRMIEDAITPAFEAVQLELF